MSIVTIDEASAYVRSEQGIDQAWLTTTLGAAHDALYKACDRSFELADTVASARPFVPSGSSLLEIHDCSLVTAVTLSGSAVTGYQAEPFTVSRSGAYRPYERLRMLGGWWWSDGTGEATISVTGKWGWTTPPDWAKEAVKIVFKDLATNRDVRGGYVTLGEAGAAAVRRNPSVREFVGSYGRGFGIA
jgi:hypothetical protein